MLGKSELEDDDTVLTEPESDDIVESNALVLDEDWDDTPNTYNTVISIPTKYNLYLNI